VKYLPVTFFPFEITRSNTDDTAPFSPSFKMRRYARSLPPKSIGQTQQLRVTGQRPLFKRKRAGFVAEFIPRNTGFERHDSLARSSGSTTISVSNSNTFPGSITNTFSGKRNPRAMCVAECLTFFYWKGLFPFRKLRIFNGLVLNAPLSSRLHYDKAPATYATAGASAAASAGRG